MSSNGTYGYEVGRLEFAHYDLGVVLALGGVLLNGAYVLNYSGLDANIPIVFENPEQTLLTGKVPCMIILRDDIAKAEDPRNYNQDFLDYRLPAVDATSVVATTVSGDITGWSKYRVKKNARSFDLTYTIQIYDRYRNKVGTFLERVFEKLMIPRFIAVTDSLGNTATYTALLDSDVMKLDEFASINQRYLGFGLSLRVAALIDIYSEEIEQNMITKITERDWLVRNHQKIEEWK